MNRFERLRYEKNLTQQQVADGAGVSRGTIIRLEGHRDPKPSVDVARRLATFYEVSLDELLGLEQPEAA